MYVSTKFAFFSDYPDDFARKAHVTGVKMFTKEIHLTDKTILTFHTLWKSHVGTFFY